MQCGHELPSPRGRGKGGGKRGTVRWIPMLANPYSHLYLHQTLPCRKGGSRCAAAMFTGHAFGEEMAQDSAQFIVPQ